MKKRLSSFPSVTKAGHLLVGLVMLAVLGACDDSTGPGGTGIVSLSVGLKSGPAPSPSLFAQGLELTDGTNTLVIESAELVLREIEFEREGGLGCDDDVSGVDDDCEEFETGPFLVPLPLDGSVSTTLSARVDAGIYDEVELEIHKPDDDDPQDIDFLNRNPSFVDVSVRVTGTYNDQNFSYISDLNAEQEIELTDPLVVAEGAQSVNVTLLLDMSAWFLDPVSSLLVDPTTALKGQPNEELVENNIEQSIEGFRDDDEDGVPHSSDDDEIDD